MSDRANIAKLAPTSIGAKFLPAPGQAPARPTSTRAASMLFLTTLLWGLSFPLGKSLALGQAELLPQSSSWFYSAVTLLVRFGIAAAILALAARRSLSTLKRSEFSQGMGLGVFASGGLLLQLDGLNYTAASTSAFLTSCYCIIIPVFVALQRQRRPPSLVIGSCGLVVVGMAILAGIDWKLLRLGRGEWETLVSSIFFGAQILWLERPRFEGNRTLPVSTVMFTTIALASAPFVLGTMRSGADVWTASAGSWPIVFSLGALTLVCTVATFTMMNHWQRYLEATEAGLIYCAEPVFASVLALFLPGLIAIMGGPSYANETMSVRLLIGGGLITLANALIQLRPRAVTPIR